MGGTHAVMNDEAAPVQEKTVVAVPAAQAGDFDAWYRALHPRPLAAMVLSTGRLDDAAEATDEALARALERWDAVSRMASPDGWAFQVAYNIVRRRGRRHALEERLLRRTATDVATTVPAPAGEAW